MNDSYKVYASQEYVDNKQTSWNDLQDRPFGEEGIVIEWDGVVGDRVELVVAYTGNTPENKTMSFVKVADAISPDALVGGTVVFSTVNDPSSDYPVSITITSDMLMTVGGVTYALLYGLYESHRCRGRFPSGLYFRSR